MQIGGIDTFALNGWNGSLSGYFDRYVGITTERSCVVFDLQAAGTQSRYLSDFLDIVDKVTKIVALLIGAAWAYLNYRRGRTFKRRLEPTITGKTIRKSGVLLLSGVAQVKNVGLSNVVIQQRGTAIEVLAVTRKTDQQMLATRDIDVLSVFAAHAWIEPGEPIEESFLIPVPEGDDILAFRLRLRIVSQGIEWNCDSVVEVIPAGAEGNQADAPATKSGNHEGRRLPP